MKKKRKSNTSLFVVLLIFTVILSFPLMVMISFSLRPSEVVFASILVPLEITAKNFVSVFSNDLLMRFILNSIILSLSVAGVAIIISVITGYGFSRFRFSGKEDLLLLMFATQMFPPVLVAVGFFEIIVKIGLYDNIISLILVNSALTLPFSIWMMKGYFDSIPKSIDEAAMIDGCSRIGACFKVVVPISIPGVLATGIWAFVQTWSEYLFALTFTSSASNRMVTTGIVDLTGHFVVNWGELMAYALIASAPILCLFVFLQQYFVSGLTAGAVKQ